MQLIETARRIVTECQAAVVGPNGEHRGDKRKRPLDAYLDLFSASAIVTAHDALSEKNKKKLAEMHPADAAHAALKLIHFSKKTS